MYRFFQRLFLAILELFRCPLYREAPQVLSETKRTEAPAGGPPKPAVKAVEPLNPAIGLNEELVAEARKYIGVTEKGGDNRGPEVEEFQRAVDGVAQGEPWCAGFVMYCVKKVEERFHAKTDLFRSEHCYTTWTKTPGALRVAKPTPGCIVIWRYAGTFSGHMGIVERVGTNGYIQTIEGNTGAGIDVIREGDGVYRKTRRMDPPKTVKMQVLGYIKPFTN